MIEMIIQIVILLTSALAVWLVNQNNKLSKWGSVLGLIGQPFWLYSTFSSQQWGIFLLSLFYMYCWGQGVYNNFIKGKWTVDHYSQKN